MRVAVRIAIPGIGPVRTQATVDAVSVKAFNKATVSETTVAETGVAPGDPAAFEAGVVHRDPVAVRRDPMAVRREPMAFESAVIKGLYAYGIDCGLGSDWAYSGYCDPNCYPHGCYGY
jgi:hypothetical protein